MNPRVRRPNGTSRGYHPRSGRSIGAIYFSTWDAEGSRDRRGEAPWQCPGTTIRGVAPRRCMAMTTTTDSGPGTAFAETHDRPNARTTQHRPAAKRRAKRNPLHNPPRKVSEVLTRDRVIRKRRGGRFCPKCAHGAVGAADQGDAPPEDQGDAQKTRAMPWPERCQPFRLGCWLLVFTLKG